MYHHIVARKVHATFADISAGDHESMLAGMAPTFTHVPLLRRPRPGRRAAHRGRPAALVGSARTG